MGNLIEKRKVKNKDFDKYLVPVEIGGHKPPLRILRVAQDQEIAWHNSRKFGNLQLDLCGSTLIEY